MKIVAYFLELCETHLRDGAPLLCMVDSCGSLRVLNLRETLPSWREFTTADILLIPLCCIGERALVSQELCISFVASCALMTRLVFIHELFTKTAKRSTGERPLRED